MQVNFAWWNYLLWPVMCSHGCFAWFIEVDGIIYIFFILSKGANVNAAKIHETALHHAAKANNLEMIELLVEFGANVFARDNLGKKAIHYTSPGSAAALCLKCYESELHHLF